MGERGPYIEFDEEHLCAEVWQEVTRASHFYYAELRSRLSDVKCYFQLVPVEYADYRVGMFYISPFDICLESGDRVIDPL